MPTLPENKNTIAQIAEASETFSNVAKEVMLEKSDAKASANIDSLLKMASLFANLTMT